MVGSLRRRHHDARIIANRVRAARDRGNFPYYPALFRPYHANYIWGHTSWTDHADAIIATQLNRLRKHHLSGPRELEGRPFGWIYNRPDDRRECRRFLRRNGKECIRQELAEYYDAHEESPHDLFT